MFVYLCDYVDIIDELDYHRLKHFKDVFKTNIQYPALFGKTKLKNTNLVSAKLEQTLNAISKKTIELKSYCEINV